VLVTGCANKERFSVEPCPLVENDFIRVAPDNFNFETSSGEKYVPMGAFYFNERHSNTDPMEWWDSFNITDLVNDFTLAKKLGCNTMRVWLYLSVIDGNSEKAIIGTAEDWRKIDTVIQVATEIGLRLQINLRITRHYVQVPDHLPYYLEAYKTAGKRYKDSPAIFAWSLDHEAITHVSPGEKTVWLDWLRTKYETDEENALAWNIIVSGENWRDQFWHKFVNAMHHQSEFDKIRNTKPKEWYLDCENNTNDQGLYDWQLFRDYLYVTKMEQLAKAVRSADSNHLVTIDLTTWDFPLHRNPWAPSWGGPYGYAGTGSKGLGEFVDFLSIHPYPVYITPHDPNAIHFERLAQDPKVFETEIRYLETICRYIYVNSKIPLVRGEAGWPGGKDGAYGNTAQDQLRWNMALIKATNDCSVGWINWALRDIPTHDKNFTASSGLVATAIKTKVADADSKWPYSNLVYAGPLPESEANKIKPWGKAFANVVRNAYETESEFVPGKKKYISRKLAYTADLKTLDILFKEVISDENYPCDIILTDK